MIVTDCPGCAMRLGDGRGGPGIPVEHIADFLHRLLDEKSGG